MAVLRRRRREDVRYLRRSPAAKWRHIHSKRLLLLAHLHRLFSLHPLLHVPDISHLLLVPS